MKIWWSNLKSTIGFKIVKEIIFWLLLIILFNNICGLISSYSTLLVYVGIALILMEVLVIINKLYSYYLNLKTKKKENEKTN